MIMNPDRSAVQAGTTSEASVDPNTDVRHGVWNSIGIKRLSPN